MMVELNGWHAVGQMDGEVVRLQSGRGSVYVRSEDEGEGVTVAVDPATARKMAQRLNDFADLADAQ